MTIDEDPIKDLEAKNHQLQSELDAYKKAADQNQQIKWWTAKKVTSIFLGKNLDSAIKQGITEFSEERKISKDTLSDLIAALIRRVVRVGLIAFFLALLPTAILLMQTYLLNQQNKRIDIQNDRLRQQTHLQEAERRSALIFLYGSLLEVIDREIRENEKANGIRSLSPQTIGQIIALSQRLKPYRYLENDVLIPRPLSPERAQLLISLVESKLDSLTYASIFKQATFAYADLEGVNFEGLDLQHIDLNYARLKKVSLREANLSYAKLRGVNLDSADLIQSHIQSADLSIASLRGALMMYANLKGALLNKAKLNEANLNFADLRYASLIEANLKKAKLNMANLGTEIVPSITSEDYQLYLRATAPKVNADVTFNELSGYYHGDPTAKNPGIDSYFSNLDTVKPTLETFKLPNTSLYAANLESAELIMSNLRNVNFSEANLTGALLKGSQLEGSKFFDSKLEFAEFDFSILYNTAFTSSTLELADISNAILAPTPPSSNPVWNFEYYGNSRFLYIKDLSSSSHILERFGYTTDSLFYKDMIYLDTIYSNESVEGLGLVLPRVSDGNAIPPEIVKIDTLKKPEYRFIENLGLTRQLPLVRINKAK